MMTITTRTAEEQNALEQIQATLKPHVDGLLDDFATLLADVAADDLDREISNVGHILMLTLKKTAPDLSEAQHYALPFAFIEMLRVPLPGHTPGHTGYEFWRVACRRRLSRSR